MSSGVQSHHCHCHTNTNRTSVKVGKEAIVVNGDGKPLFVHAPVMTTSKCPEKARAASS
jgi:hypothetical protein